MDTFRWILSILSEHFCWEPLLGVPLLKQLAFIASHFEEIKLLIKVIYTKSRKLGVHLLAISRLIWQDLSKFVDFFKMFQSCSLKHSGGFHYQNPVSSPSSSGSFVLRTWDSHRCSRILQRSPRLPGSPA